MKQAEFDLIVTQTIDSIRNLLIVKGGEYAGSDDRLANFKRGAALTGTTPFQCLLIYLSKHYDAFATYVRDDACDTARPRSESIEGRLDDMINYCILAKAMIAERGMRPKELSKPSFDHYRGEGLQTLLDSQYGWLWRFADGSQEPVPVHMHKLVEDLSDQENPLSFHYNEAGYHTRLVTAISSDGGQSWIKLA